MTELRAALNDDLRAARKIANLNFFPHFQRRNEARCAPVMICAQRATLEVEGAESFVAL
jgi:hypothetical protein